MARYIDADELIDKLENNKYAEPSTDFQRGINAYIDWLLLDIKYLPPADVVPKSEVEKAVEKLMSATDRVICEAKQEVAREICGWLRDDLRGMVDNNYLESLIKIYEKKYTESEGNI